jgi:Ricin-type beta-trefoil lectin domain-like
MALPNPDLYYALQARHSGGVFDVRAGSWEPGTAVQQWGSGGAGKPNQQFAFKEGSALGRFFIIARHSNLTLVIENSSIEDYAALVQAAPDELPQEFEVRPVEDDWVRLVAVHSEKTLQVFGGAANNGALIVQGRYDGERHQMFRFIDPTPR